MDRPQPFLVQDTSAWIPVSDEARGSKRKVWLVDPAGSLSQEPSGSRWLFKYTKQARSGDDWSEKVASEIAEALGLPHARYELAIRNSQQGVISLDFTRGGEAGTLVPGNELLLELDPQYPREGKYRVAQHTIGKVLGVLSQNFILPPEG